MYELSDPPALCRVFLRVETGRERAADLAGGDLSLRIFARTIGIVARKARVYALNIIELPVPSDMIIVCMRVQNRDGQIRQLRHDVSYIADSHAGVEEDSSALSQN